MGLLRALLAISVMFAHSWRGGGRLPLLGGELAVEAFYMISGFYMALVLSATYETRTKSGLLTFWLSRALRIYPAYWAVAGVTFFVALVGNTKWLPNFLSAPPDVIALASFANLTLFGSDWLFWLKNEGGELSFTSTFLGFSDIQPFQLLIVPQSWTLGLELLFYAIVPWLNRLKSSWLIAILVASIIARLLTYNLLKFDFDPWTYRFFPFEIAMFIAGILSYRASRQIGEPSRAASWLWFAAVIIFLLAYPTVRQDKIFGFDIEGSLFLVSVACALPWIFALTGNWSIDREIGDLSYPIYLCHLLVITIISRFGVNKLGVYASAALTLAAVISVAWIIKRFIDAPIDDWRHHHAKDFVARFARSVDAQ